MKKLFLVLAVATLGFVACNNEAENKDTEKDSLNAIDSAANAMKDSIETTSDSIKANIDSAANAAKDSVKGTN
jgi:hypothetical protein